MNKEQIKNQIFKYLDKTSRHTFVRPNGTIFKVIKSDNNFKIYEDGHIYDYDIDYFINIWGENSKNVIKHRLFLNQKKKSIKNIDNNLLILQKK